MKLIIEYWAQIAVLLAAIGYICKVFLDYSFKRKEIGYTIYSKERLSTITNFISKYEQTQSEIRVSIFNAHMAILKGGKIQIKNSTPPEYLDHLRNEMRHSRLFLSAKEFDLFHELTANLDLLDGEFLYLFSKLESYNLPIEEAAVKWYDESEEILNNNESLLEEFIDKLRNKYSKRS